MKHVTIYTDGACSGNPGLGGWGAVLIYMNGAAAAASAGDHVKELSGGEKDTTNNRMEMTGAIEALRALKAACQVTLYTDSTYVLKGITEWLPGWKARGWKTADKKPVKNADLWQALEAETKRHHIEWKWVKGHNGDPMNERADALATGAPGYEHGFKLTLHPDRLSQPIKRKKPTTYFVNSMSDLFHEDIPFEYLDQVFDVIRQTPHHTYQILTKRADQMEAYFQNREVPVNAWVGVSVEDKKYGLPRIDYLRRVKAATRFLSVEPLLEDLGTFDLTDIHWVIVGGESGNKARPMKPEWVENIANQCTVAGTAFFFKQWGTWGADGVKRTKHANDREFQGRTWDGIPTNPQMRFALSS